MEIDALLGTWERVSRVRGSFFTLRRWATGLSAVGSLWVGLLWGSACGPVQSTSYLIDAEVALEAAKTAQAERFAPYEWTAANLYYRKAREEVGYSDFEQAIDFAQKAGKYATQARENALKAGRRDEPQAAPPAPYRP